MFFSLLLIVYAFTVIELPCHFGFAATKDSKSLAAGTFCTTNGFQPEITKPSGGAVPGLTKCEGFFLSLYVIYWYVRYFAVFPTLVCTLCMHVQVHCACPWFFPYFHFPSAKCDNPKVAVPNSILSGNSDTSNYTYSRDQKGTLVRYSTF